MGMLEYEQGTGTSTSSSEHGSQSIPWRGSSLNSRSSSIESVRCSSSKPSGLPSNGIEPQADDVVRRPSALHLVERIIKRLMKLRKKALLASSRFPLDLFRAILDGGACVRSQSLESAVDVERGYETDEQSGFVSMGMPTSSLSSSSSPSSIGSSSFESLGTQVSAVTRSHKPGSQMMAKILLSLLEEEAGRFTVQEEDAYGYGDEEEYQFRGPRESAWHQPEEEIVTDMEWRMMHYGHPQSKSAAALAATKKQQSCFCNNYLAMGEYPSSKLQRNISAASHNNSFSSRLKRVTLKVM